MERGGWIMMDGDVALAIYCDCVDALRGGRADTDLEDECSGRVDSGILTADVGSDEGCDVPKALGMTIISPALTGFAFGVAILAGRNCFISFSMSAVVGSFGSPTFSMALRSGRDCSVSFSMTLISGCGVSVSFHEGIVSGCAIVAIDSSGIETSNIVILSETDLLLVGKVG